MSFAPMASTRRWCSMLAPASAPSIALLEAGAGHAIDVDSSREYLAASREGAQRRGQDQHVDYREQQCS